MSSPLVRAAIRGALLAVGTLSASLAAAAPPPGYEVGVTAAGPASVQETMGEMMERQRAWDALHGPEPFFVREEIEKERDDLPQNPESPEASRWPLTADLQSAGGSGGRSAQTVAFSFTAVTSNEVMATPPDSMGAVGPTQFILAVNNRLRSFSKTTGVADRVVEITPNLFFNSIRANSRTSDPRIRFDRLTGRWFIVIINVSGSPGNRILFASSSAGTIAPSTVWTLSYLVNNTSLGVAGRLADYPTLGIDANALYVGVNQFNLSPDTYLGTSAWVIRKSSIIAGGGPIVSTLFDNLTGDPGGSGMYTPQGVDNFDPSATEGYFIGTDNAAFGRLVLRRVSDPGGTPAISADIGINVPTTTQPIGVPSQGSLRPVSPVDDRLFAAHFRNGSIWTAHNIQVDGTGVASNSGGRNGSRWYELGGIASPGTPAVVQAGTLFDPSATTPRSYFIPSIMVSGQGHAALGCSIGSAATTSNDGRLNAFATGRFTGDAAGTMRNDGTPGNSPAYTASTTAYNLGFDTGAIRRWGDYSYTSVDPCDDMTMWTVQEFCSASNVFADRVAKLLAPAPTLDDPADSAPQGAVAKVVNLTGTGIFDPGSAFACRLTVGIAGGSPNGISNLAVSYLSPTSAQVAFDVAPGAAIGPRDIVLTNPDGQSTTLVGGFSVTNSFGPDPTLEQAGAQPDPVNVGPIRFDVDFGRDVTGFDASDIAFGGTAGGTLAATIIPVTAATYSVEVTGMTTSGVVTASILAGAVIDASSRPSHDSSSIDNSVTWDVAGPVPTVSLAAGQAASTNTGPIAFAIDFDEAPVNFADTDLVLGGTAGGTLAAFLSGGPLAYQATISGMTTDGTVTLSVPAASCEDALGNPNGASAAVGDRVTWDTTPPGLSGLAPAAGQTDPATSLPVRFAASFDEPILGFDGTDVLFSGSTAPGTLAASVNPASRGVNGPFTISVDGATGAGVIQIAVNGAGLTDDAGNPGTSSSTSSVVYNGPPTVVPDWTILDW